MQEKIKIKLIVDLDRKDERDCFFLSGIRRLKDRIDIVENEEYSDFVFCHRSDSTNNWYPPTLNNLKKLVVLDYTDIHNNADYFDNYGYYFKRSCVIKNGFSQRLIDKMDEPNFYSLPYSIKYVNDKDVHEVLDLDNIQKSIDITCFFNPGSYGDIRGMVSFTVLNFCKRKNLKCHIGQSGVDEISYNGRENFLKNYYEINKSSRIVVTSNHNNWEGDWRLYESLSVGTCLFVDKMLIPVKNPLIDGVHLVYYNSIEDLENKLDYYINNPELIDEMSVKSKEFVYKHHTPVDRMNYILDTITNN